jgi:hypothetical protein
MKSAWLTKLLIGVGAILVAAIFTAPAAMARTPAPGYEAFAGCPSPEENSEVLACVHSVVKSGHFQMGTKDVPITNPMTLAGGFNNEGELFASPKGGLTPVKQQVPGGIIGLTGLDWLVNFLNIEQLKLYAVTELAGQPDFSFDLISLPVKVHLINPALGSSCYVGSSSSPIKLNIGTGTTSPPLPNKPITGKTPTIAVNEATGVVSLNSGTFVDNSFSAPGASGCVLTLFGFIPISINGLVNSQSGLPAAAGTNETIQNIDADLVSPSLVYP